MSVRPSSNFPGNTQEAALQTLVRKKPDPEVEAMIDKCRKFIEEDVTEDGLKKVQEVWVDARDWIQKRIMTYVSEEAGDVYTKEEREKGVENVRTGLKRDLEEDDDDDDEDEDEDEDEEMEGTEQQPRKPKEEKATKPEVIRGPEPETLFWFAARGDFAVPENVQYSRQDGQPPYKGLQGINIPQEQGDTDQDTQP